MMRADVRRYLVAYDIPQDKRRARIAKFLQGYGDRVQYSVFVIDCSPARRVRMGGGLEDLIIPAEDSILVCDLGPLERAREASFSYIGATRPITEGGSFIV